MGIFKSIKQYFSSDIRPEANKLANLVTPYPLKNGAIKMDSKVVVPQAFAFVLGHNGKALDAFREGEYIMAPAVLPECCKKLKIHKMDKQGNFKKKFKADLYFISLKPYNFVFKTGQCVEMGNRSMGIFTAGAEGKAKLSVKDPRIFLSHLLDEFAYLRNGEAEKIVQSWICDCVVSCFQKNNFALSELVSINPMVESKSKSDVALILAKRGLTLDEFEFTTYNLPKRHQKEYLANKNKQKNNDLVKEETKELNKNDDCEPMENEINQTMQECTPVNVEIQKQEEYVPFGNINFEEKQETCEVSEVESVQENACELEQTENVDLNSQDENVESNVENQTQEENQGNNEFVDLDIDKIVAAEDEGKRCLNCGAINEYESANCNVCGKKF